MVENNEIYRDDKGGWIRASELEGISHKVVGADFRGLPIIHIGRGRPKTSIIKLLMLDPNITAKTSDSNDTVQKGKTVDNNNYSYYMVLYNRVSRRMSHHKQINIFYVM
mgnify:FL=1